ncbi:MAG: DUF4330 family protein [Ruminococcaceae bacterium]|nr:DUF4330 family protein [Oscillospiraceae bacterium]
MAEQSNKSFRFNIIDVLITIVIVVALALFVMIMANSFGVNASTDKENKTIEYTVQFKGIRAEFADNIKVNTTVVDGQKRHNLGKIVSVSDPELYQTEVYDEETRSMKLATNPDYITVEIKVSADGYLDDGMYYLKESDKEIGVGTFLYIHLPDFCGSGYVSAMKVK